MNDLSYGCNRAHNKGRRTKRFRENRDKKRTERHRDFMPIKINTQTKKSIEGGSARSGL